MSDELDFLPLKPAASCYIESVGSTYVSMPWFVGSGDKEEGQPVFVARPDCEVTPLVNGEQAFGTLEQAIRAAQTSIDYITWGFDPSMRFTSGGISIGELLLKCLDARPNLQVRLLVWYGGYFWSMAYGQADTGLTERGQGSSTANLPGYNEYPGEASKYVSATDWYKKAKKQPRLHFETRSLNVLDGELNAVNSDKDIPVTEFVEFNALTKTATHHQKMVLIDYATPKTAVGFVMGSNTLQRYWDTSEHRLHHENRRTDFVETLKDYDQVGRPYTWTRPGKVYYQPWQDISSRVRGGLLFDLHTNFARSWQRAGGGALEPARKAIKPTSFDKYGDGPMQVLRTQPQEDAKTIKDAYFQNVRNARNYIYFENQYFRLHELVKGLNEAARALQQCGRKQSLYLFVVTNVPDKHGRLSTYEMLTAMGHGQQMPVMHADRSASKLAIPPEPSTQGGEQAGLQTVVCTLTANEGTKYQPIYTHSKLMIIDDNYFTLGSANLNRRSMLSDSELNVSVPNPGKAKALRQELWQMHKGLTLAPTTVKEFKDWVAVAKKNLTAYQTSKESLVGHLTLFMDNGAATTTKYD